METRSRRLKLIAATPASIRAEMEAPSALAALLDAAVPADWPPETLQDALPQFLEWHEQHPDWVGWLAWYAVRLDTAAPVVCGSVGFKGAPGADGVAEIGYSVLPANQGLGLATEMVETLLRWAWAQGRVRCVEAETSLDNRASIGVLERTGFSLVAVDDRTRAARYRLSRRCGYSAAGGPGMRSPATGQMPASAEMRAHPVKIERLNVGDGERLRAIRLRALRDAPDAFGTTAEEAASRAPEDWNRQLEQLETFVAYAGDHDVGLVRGARHDRCGDAGYLISMWVAPEARRQGIGSALVDAIAGWAKAQGFNRLLLDVGEKNAPAIALYARKGFLASGEVGTLPPPRDHVREIQMAKRLSD